MIVSGLEILWGSQTDRFIFEIVNPKNEFESSVCKATKVCGFSGFYDPDREKEIRECTK